MNEQNLEPQPMYLPFLSGFLTDETLLIEVLSWIHQSRRRALMTLGTPVEASPEQRFSAFHPVIEFYFDRGQLIYVGSRDPHHRLGAILLRRGDLNEGELRETLMARTGLRLGDALISRGIISRDQLIAALREQAMIILHYTLTPSFSSLTQHAATERTEAGNIHFSRFELSDYSSEALPLKLNLDMQNLLLEVLRQQDEVKMLLKYLPPLEVKPTASRRPEEGDEPMVAFALLQCSGDATLGTLIFSNPISALEALHLYRNLIDQGLILIDEDWTPQSEETIHQVLDQEGLSSNAEEWFDLCFTPEID